MAKSFKVGDKVVFNDKAKKNIQWEPFVGLTAYVEEKKGSGYSLSIPKQKGVSSPETAAWVTASFLDPVLKENKMNNDKLTRIIEETILEMLKEEDEGLVNLMMEYEKNLGEDETDRSTFINETIEALSDKLGVLNEEEGANEEKSLLSEQRKMLSLTKYLETGDESVLREAKANPYAITKDEWKKVPKDYKMTKAETKDSRFPGIRGYDAMMAGSLPDRLKDEAKKNGDTGTGLVPVKVS